MILIRKPAFLLAVCLLLAGCATTASLKQQKQAESLLGQGYALYRQGDVMRASRAWISALEKDPSLYKAHYNLGKAYEDQGAIERAIEEYGRALEIEPEFVPALVNRALLLDRQGKTAQALNDLQQAFRLRPDNASILFNLGRLQARQGKTSRAMELFSKALELAPNMSAASNNRGIIHLERGEYTKAVSDFSRAVDNSEDNADYYFNRAVALERKEALERAFSDYTRAIEKNPNHASAYYNRGLLRIHQGRQDSGCLDLSVACDLGLCSGLQTLLARGSCREAAARHGLEPDEEPLKADDRVRERQPGPAAWSIPEKAEKPGSAESETSGPVKALDRDKETVEQAKKSQPAAQPEVRKKKGGSASTGPANRSRPLRDRAEDTGNADRRDRSRPEPEETGPGGHESKPSPGSASLPGEEQAAYAASLDVLLEKNDPLQARKMLQQFISEHPESGLLPNVHYWLGETYYVRKEYKASIRVFEKVLERFPRHHKAPDALLKIGLARYSLGQKERARSILQRVLRDFPSSRTAEVAERKLRSLL